MTSRLERTRRIFIAAVDALAAVYTLILLGQLVLFFLTTDAVSGPRAVAAGLCTLGILALFTRIHRAAFRGDAAPVRELAASGVLGVAALVFSPGVSGDAALIFWLFGMVLFVPRPAAAVLILGVILFNSGYILLAVEEVEFTWPTVLYLLWAEGIWAIGASALLVLWMLAWRIIIALHEGQEARAQLAVSEERLRFARDLHDLLGHTLSVIALKSEVATRLTPPEAGRGRREMAEVHRLAREGLSEVRSAVHGYRTLHLEEELANARAVLEAAGMECAVVTDTADLADGERELLAWAVREGTTNILKHSAATRCTISVADRTLEMRNDGAEPEAEAGGSGLRGLAERITAVGGSVSGAPGRAGEFVLRVALSA